MTPLFPAQQLHDIATLLHHVSRLLAGGPKPWHPETVTVASARPVFKPRLAPVA